ncbi:chromosome segregation ATPase [Catenovulum agarivorans DS-2]|uniref:Chromosome partition protein Smc n=1 Tax=Catenovulum agarivorans DS-2 TaxID=1328313 RepID=W7QL60_9ALTE|nr:chromosome segregation protein SMC [Catenovulum agarivorans]EWH08878.1 chromosome segregation ATPase [Catenovulum agarivorans DS-2]
MRLKQIKLAGFKSFVDPTTVPFPAQMSAIVGPNGCGKSNIIDAVRWVLGESSAKNLRGDNMTDVIFNGSSARKPVSQASIELVFDNSEGRLQGEYAKYNEISVKRSVNRDPTSSYFLNGTKCRKKDITDLFLGTGLGPRSYAIIEQGMISRLIESKPQDLRLFIEEAAGISKYKERRRETETRIRHTRDNLERLEDVLSELQAQLEKLQRQASAAKRYKELKAKERKLKAELAVLKWMRLNGQADVLQQDIQQKQLELDSLTTEQRGDEAQLVELKQAQFLMRQKLEHITNDMFKIAQNISKNEQSIVHLKEKKQHFELEKRQLQDDVIRIEERIESEQEHVANSSFTISELEPELEILSEQVYEAEIELEEKSTEYERFSNEWAEKSKAYFKLESEIAAKKSQCDTIRHIINTSSQRLQQLSQALSELTQPQDINLEQITEEAHITEARLETLQEQNSQTQDQLQADRQQCKDTQRRITQYHTDINQIRGRIASLETLINHQKKINNKTVEHWLKQHGLDGQATELSSHIKVASGWEKAVELVLSQWQKALLIEQALPEMSADYPAGFMLATTDTPHTIDKNSLTNSLASQVTAPDFVLNILANVKIDLSEPTTNYSVINQQGDWRGLCWQFRFDDSKQSVFELDNQLEQSNQQLASKQLEIEQAQARLEQQETEVYQLQEKSQNQLNTIAETKQQLHQYSVDIKQAQSQLAFYKQQQSKLENEQSALTEQIELEQMRLEEVLMGIEELSENLQDNESANEGAEQQKHQLQQSVVDARSKKDNLNNQKHQLQLKLEQAKSAEKNGQQMLASSQTALEQVKQKLALIQEQAIESAEPIEEMAAELQMLLEEKAQQTELKQQTQLELDEVDSKLAELEKGQHGIMDKANKLKEDISQLKIEQEGYRVRARSVIEVLAELEVSFKQISQEMPTDAEENEWERELEKTTGSINRLGAINLAAIEEYEHQAERKTYLDAQHHDLISALETLEDAIRKIDRETKSRFRDTFENVNADLRMLFPKVFGGGAAWLELTDDDLLETGVTIMARPPGKRNSTIHLLSGGEKALTALSLVFAIFRLNPAPFCMLDEVDAPLDDANVGRFCRLVEEMSSTVQFIYISHNKIAMEMASHLVGVTMQEPGVSRMVAVDIEKAIELAELQ